MLFIDWIKRFEKRSSPIGDLARDIKTDRNTPDKNTFEAWATHLVSEDACREAVATLKSAWRKYEREQAHARTID